MTLLNNIHFHFNKNQHKVTSTTHMHTPSVQKSQIGTLWNPKVSQKSLPHHWAHWGSTGRLTEEGRGVFFSWKWRPGEGMNKIWHFLSIAAAPVSARKHHQAIREFMLNNCSSCKVTIVSVPHYESLAVWFSVHLILFKTKLNSESICYCKVWVTDCHDILQIIQQLS